LDWIGLVCLALEVLASSVARWYPGWCQRFLGHSYSFMPVCAAALGDPTTTTLLVRELSDGGKLLPTCSRAQRARVPVKSCTASPYLPLFVAQACWSLTSKLRPPGASLSSQYRPVCQIDRCLEKADRNLSPLGYGPSQSEHTDGRSGLRKGASQPHPRGIPPPPMPVAFFAEPCRWSGHRASP
jgi:hypothetical protein